MRSTATAQIGWLVSFTLVIAMGRTASVQGQQALYSRAGADLSRDVPLAIVGGTLIDVRDYGRSTEDIAESTIYGVWGTSEPLGFPATGFAFCRSAPCRANFFCLCPVRRVCDLPSGDVAALPGA